MKRFIALAAVSLAAAAATAARAEQVPDAATLLFDEPQLSTTRPGDVLTYSYSRKSADEAQFGPSFDDKIRLTVDKGASEATRVVAAQMFSGAHRKPAGPFGDMVGNPVLSLMLEQNVEGLSAELGANPRYFKTAIRTALREKASVVADTVEVGGVSQPAWRVTVTPFKDDSHKARMKGLDALTYEFKVAKAVPGQIVEIRIGAPAASGGPLFEERTDYVAKTD